MSCNTYHGHEITSTPNDSDGTIKFSSKTVDVSGCKGLGEAIQAAKGTIEKSKPKSVPKALKKTK